jgi:hypothetical protein
MKFKPRTKEEIDSMNLIKAGVYSFRVANAAEQTSKSGNEMLKLTLEVFDEQGAPHTVFDYLLEAMPQKLYSFCHATNMTQQYQMGQMRDIDCIDKCAYVEITVEKGQPNPQGGVYADKNQVKCYLSSNDKKAKVSASVSSAVAAGKPDNGFDDEIPF